MSYLSISCWICIVYGIYLTLQFLNGFIRRVFSVLLPRNLPTEYGEKSWVVITGASDGIGAVFCTQYARLGFNICLVSRTVSKLESVEKVIKQVYPDVKTMIVQADFGKTAVQPTMYESIYEQIKDLDISLLINCAGVYYVGFFENIEQRNQLSEINVNCMATIHMTRKVIPLLLEHTKKTGKKAGIINVASYAGLRECPTSAVYAATKTATHMFSECLQAQYKEKLDILSLCPMLVTTAMTRNRKTILSVSAVDCARSAVWKLGRVNMTVGHWIHELQYAAMSILPNYIAQRIQRKTLDDLVKAYTQIDNAKKTN